MAGESAESPEAAAPRRARRWPWILGIVGGVLLLGLVLLLAMLPALLSTGAGRGWATGVANASIPGRVQVQDLRLSWSSGIGVTGLDLLDPEGGVVIEGLSVDAPRLGLWPLAMGATDLGEVRITARRVALRQPEQGTLNLRQALAETPAEPAGDEPVELPRGLSGKVTFSAESITYESPGVEPVELTGFEATVDAPSLDAVTATMTSALKQAERTGRIEARFDVTGAVDADGVLQLAAAKVDGSATLENLPVAMVDRLAEQGGGLVALVGPWLTVEAQAQGPVTGLSASLQGSSPNLTADLTLSREAQAWAVAPGGRVVLTVTPEAAARWLGPAEAGVAEDADRGGGATLRSPVEVTLSIDRARVPMDDAGQPDLAGATLGATLTLGDVEATAPGVGRLGVRGGKVELSSDRLGERVTLTGEAEARVAGRAEPLSFALAVDRPLATGDAGPKLELTQTRIPLALADAVAGMQGKLVTTLGPSLDASLTASAASADGTEGGYAFDGRLSTARLELPLAGSWTGGRTLTVRTPSDATLALTPEAWSAWLPAKAAEQAPAGEAGQDTPQAEPLRLAETTTLTLALKELRVTQPDPGAAGGDGSDAGGGLLAPAESSVSAEIRFPSMRLTRAPDTRVVVTSGVLSVQADSLADAIDVTLQALLDAAVPPEGAAGSGGSGGGGEIEADVSVSGLFDAAGRLQPGAASVTGKGAVRNTPSAVIDGLLQQGGRLAPVLGQTTTLTYELDYAPGSAGAVSVDLGASNATGRVVGRITPEGRLELVEDATLSVGVTPEVSRVMLRSINPMLGATVAASAPLSLTVRKQGFSAPLTGGAWQSVDAEATLDLGELTLAPRGIAGTLFQTLSRFEVIPNQQQYSAVVSPLDLSIDGGVMAYRGLSLTVSGVDLGFAGRVSLVDQGLNLDLRVGGERLAEAGLDRLDLAIGGTIDQPRLDTDALVRGLLEAGARRGLREALGRELGPEGEAVGGLLDAILGGGGRSGQQQDDNADEPER